MTPEERPPRRPTGQEIVRWDLARYACRALERKYPDTRFEPVENPWDRREAEDRSRGGTRPPGETGT